MQGTTRHGQVRTRLWEIDVARGVAVVLMIFFHLMWDLQYLGLSTANVFSTPWQAFARGIGSSFAFLLGLSLVLVGSRLNASNLKLRQGGLQGGLALPEKPLSVLSHPASMACEHLGSRGALWRYALRRGGMIFALGMLVTLGTYLALGEQYVRFGILHLLGSMLVIAVPFVFLGVWPALTVGLLMVVLGALVAGQTIAGPWLLWLGVAQAGVTMADYYPLLPWGGPVLIGVAFGQWAYRGGVRGFRLPDLSAAAPMRALGLLGRHSLLVYLLHQPVLLGALFALRQWW